MELSEHAREASLMDALVLNEEDVAKYSHLLEWVGENYYPGTSSYSLEEYANERREESAYYFSRDNLGFDSKIKVEQDTLAFYTVPYEPGWTATVNGKDVDIVKSNIGFMAVPVSAGENDIRFNYMTPGLKSGLLASGLSLLAILLYAYAIPRMCRKKRAGVGVSSEIGEGVELETEAEVEVEVEVETEAEVEVEVEVEVETEAETEAEVEMDVEASLEIESESQTETEAEAESDLEAESETEAESESEV